MNSELKLVYKPEITVQNNNFEQYTEHWTGSVTGTTIVPPIYTTISGWSWDKGRLSHYGSNTYSIWQTITEPQELDVQYELQFFAHFDSVNGSFIPYLFGNSGTTVTSTGNYRQRITPTSGNPVVMFTPDTNFYGYITDIRIVGVTIKNESLDLYDENDISLTYQVGNGMSDISSSYSKTIRIPGTDNNNRLINNLFIESNFVEPNTYSDSNVIFFNKKLNAILYNSSVEVMRGFLEINSCSKTDGKIEYDTTFYSNNRNLADVIGDKYIRGNYDTNDDIKIFDKYNHYFTWANIQSSWDTGSTYYTTSTGYYYPFIDFAGLPKGTDFFRVENLKPAFYAKELWDEIFNRSNFTYTSSFLTSSAFKNLVIPHPNELVEPFADTTETFKVGIDNYYDWVKRSTDGVPTYTYVKFPFNQTSGGTLSNPLLQFDTSTNSWVITSTGCYNFTSAMKFDLKIDIDNNSPTTYLVGSQHYIFLKLALIRRSNGIDYTVSEEKYPIDCTRGCVNSGDWLTFDDVTNRIYMIADEVDCFDGDEFFIRLGYSVGLELLDCDPQAYNPKIYGNITLRISETSLDSDALTFFNKEPVKKNYYYLDSLVYGNNMLPIQMKQIDFIKSISNKFNLVYVENPEKPGDFIIEPYDIFYSGTTFLDWSDKVNRNKEIKIERIPILIDRNVEFNFEEDDSDQLLIDYLDKTTRNYGDYKIENPYLGEETTKVKDVFSSTMLDYISNTNLINSKIYKWDNEVCNYLPTENDYNTRLLYRKTIYDSGFTMLKVIAIDNLSGITVPTYEYSGVTFLHIGDLTGVDPYAGILDDPYNPTLDLNYGSAKYSFIDGRTQNNLVWTYWRNKLSLYLDPNSKKVTYYIRLNVPDISTINFRTKIMIDNSLYIISRIIDWNNGMDCKVELYQLNTYVDYGFFTTDEWINPSKSTPQNVKNVLDLNSGKILTDNTTSLKTTQNSYPQNSTGIVIGNSNTMKSGDFMVYGSDNQLNDSDGYIINGSGNILSSNNTLINSNNITIDIPSGGTYIEQGIITGGTYPDWDWGTDYYLGDEVKNTVSGITTYYRYINTNPTQGAPLSSSTWWLVIDPVEIVTTSGITYNTSVIAMNWMTNSGKTITETGLYIGDLSYSGSTKTLVIDERGKVFYNYISNNGSSGTGNCCANWEGGNACSIYGGIPVIDGGGTGC